MAALLRRARPGAPDGQGSVRQRVAMLVVLVVALLFPLAEGGNVTVMGIAIEALSYGLITLALNLLMGYGGQVSIGHGGLLAVGAYTTAIVATRFGLPFIVVLLLAGVVTGVVGLLLGLPAGRLRSHYLAVATLGFGVAVPQIALNLGSLTGGFTGLIVPPAYVGGVLLNNPGNPVPLYYLALGILALSAVAISSLLASPTGRRIMAVRDSEHTAPTMGINAGRTKVIVFTVSSFFCGLAGYVFALNNGIVEPASFTFSLSLFFFAAVIVGGLGSIWGSLIGAALLVVVQQESVSLGGFSEAILGAAVVVVLLLIPGGLVGLPRRLRALVTGRGTGAMPGSPVSRPAEPASAVNQHPAPPSSAGTAREG